VLLFVRACVSFLFLCQFLVLARHLYMLNSRTIYDVLNPMHKFTIRRHSSGKAFKLSSLSRTSLRFPLKYSILQSISKSVFAEDVRYELKISQNESTVSRSESTGVDRMVGVLKGAVI
jgi:hypothetical protein